jgi:hypothetical protein
MEVETQRFGNNLPSSVLAMEQCKQEFALGRATLCAMRCNSVQRGR